VDGRVKPGHDGVVGMQVTENTKSDDLASELPKANQPDLNQFRPIGLHAGQGFVHDDFNDPLPDEFWGF
jgi:hypothetical protein